MATTTRKPHSFRPDADTLETREVLSTFTGFGSIRAFNPIVVPTQVGTSTNFSTGTLGVRNPFIKVPSNINPTLAALNGGRLTTASPNGVNGTLGVGLPSGFAAQSGLAFLNGLGGFGSGSFNSSSGLGFNGGLGGTSIGSLLSNNFASVNNLFNSFVPSFTGVSTAFGVNNNLSGVSNTLNTLGSSLGTLGLNSGLNGLSNLGLGVNTGLNTGLASGLSNLGIGLNNNFNGLLPSGFGVNNGTGSLLNTTLGSNQFSQFGLGTLRLFGR